MREGCDRRENNILGCDRYSVIVCSVHYKISVKEAASLIILILGVVGRSALRYVLRVSRGLQIATFQSAATGSFRRHYVFSAFEHSSSTIFRNRVFLVLQMPLVIVLQRAPCVG